MPSLSFFQLQGLLHTEVIVAGDQSFLFDLNEKLEAKPVFY
jgi:hypothetical protein